jgi:hypothetical protein
MTASEIETGVLGLIEGSRTFGIPSSDLDDMAELARSAEAGVAFENLCTQLREYEALVPPELFQELEHFGTAMQIDKRYWTVLRVDPG